MNLPIPNIQKPLDPDDIRDEARAFSTSKPPKLQPIYAQSLCARAVTRYYRWVQGAIATVAKALGATVKVVHEEMTDDDDA